VTSIGESAFEHCSGLTSVTIGSGVINSGWCAFYQCNNLMAVHISDLAAWCRNSFYHAYSNPLFEASTLYLNGSLVTDIAIPPEVTSVAPCAFVRCTSLTSVTIPESVTNIGGTAFYSCSGLTKVTFEGNAPNVGNYAFSEVNSSCTAYVREGSTGWGVAIPGTWKGLRIEYIESGSGGGSGGGTQPSGGKYDLGFSIGSVNTKEWSDSMFVTTTQGGIEPMTSIKQGSKIYLYYAYKNLAGDFDVSGFVIRFTLNTGATFEHNWMGYTLEAGHWGWSGESWSPSALQDLAPGTYTLTCKLDATDQLVETNEDNNTKSITFTIVASDLDEEEFNPLVKIYCLVSFDPNGGDSLSFSAGGVLSRYMLERKTLGAYGDLPVPTRSGYTFVGWFTAASGGTQVTAFTKITGNVTYYAHWEKIGGDDSGSGGGSVTPTTAPSKEIVKQWTAKKAVILNGAMYDSAGNVAGVIQLKVAKPNVRKGTAKVSGYVMPIDGKKAMLTTSTANVSATAPMNVTATARSLGALTVKIGDDGFSGRVGNYIICTANVGGNWTRTNAKVHVATSSLPDGTLKALLPNGEPVLAKGGKWAFNKGASVKLSKDKSKAEWDTSGGKSNLSSMKLTYTPKTGLFKGSFKVYALEAAKLKKYTANVTGVVVDGKGYGQATIKKPVAGPWAVTVE